MGRTLDGCAWRRKGLRTSFFVLIFATDDQACLDEFLSEVHRITGHKAVVVDSGKRMVPTFQGLKEATILEIGIRK